MTCSVNKIGLVGKPTLTLSAAQNLRTYSLRIGSERELDIGRRVPRSRLDHEIEVVLRNTKQLLRRIITLPHDEIRGSEVETATLEGIAHVNSSSHGRNDKANKAKGRKSKQTQKESNKLGLR
jgi:hypothetical protein